MFSALSTIFLLGNGPKPGDFLLLGERGLAEELALFRNLRNIVDAHPDILERSELAPIFSPSLPPLHPAPLQNQHLEALRRKIMSVGTNRDVQVYLTALEQLTRVFPGLNSESRSSQASPLTAFIWLYLVSGEFLACLQRRDQVALVVMAHFCVLLNDLRGFWAVEGWVGHLMGEIYGGLGEEWRGWIGWPMGEIGWIPGS